MLVIQRNVLFFVRICAYWPLLVPWVFEKRGINFEKQGGVKLPSCNATYYLSVDCVGVLHTFIDLFRVILVVVVQPVGPSSLGQTARLRWFVVAVCFMLLCPLSGFSGSLWFGPAI